MWLNHPPPVLEALPGHSMGDPSPSEVRLDSHSRPQESSLSSGSMASMKPGKPWEMIRPSEIWKPKPGWGRETQAKLNKQLHFLHLSISVHVEYEKESS